MRLLISQKDDIFDLIEETNYFVPSQFEITEIQADWDYKTRIHLKNSRYFFEFIPRRNYQGTFYANFSPGESSLIETTSHLGWNEGVGYFFNWLENLRRELTAPNKWERLFHEMENIKIAPTDDKTKFTYLEYFDLTKKINQIKASLDTIPLLEEQQLAMINQLNHLTELAQELNKYDWKNLFIGTMLSVPIQLSVTPENSAKLWQLIKAVFSNYFLP